LEADESTTPFSIPDGEVLVITGYMMAVSGMTPGDMIKLFVEYDSAAGFTHPFLQDGTVANVEGSATKAQVISPVVVKPGPALCARTEGTHGGAIISVQGYLTKDK